MFGKRVAFFTLLAVVAQVNPAHAITANLSVGTVKNPDTGTNDGGTFTTTPYTTTTTFNSATATLAGSTYTYAPAAANASAPTLTYTWSNAGSTSIRSDQYAPPPPNGQVINQTAAASGNNTSKYLAVFQNSPVTITSNKLLSYIGVDIGYVDSGNTLAFYNNSTLLKTFVATDFFGSPLPNPEGSSYVNFVSDNNTNDYFNKIVITETTSGSGYETDNYAVRVAPAPSQVSGILALGLMGAWNLRRGNRKPKQQKQLVTK